MRAVADHLRSRQRVRREKPLWAVLFSDGQSWIAQLSRGPLHVDVFSPLIWAGLAEVAELCDGVIVNFMFAHCGDARGDEADGAAQLARQHFASSAMATAPWHIDAQRDELRRIRDDFTTLVRAEQNFRSRHMDGAIGRPPPGFGLTRSEAVQVLRLRTGCWPNLGWGTVAFGAAPEHCRHCGHELRRGGGRAIEHLFDCASCPALGVPVSALWSQDPEVLLDVLAHCRKFLPDPDDDDEHLGSAGDAALATAA
jgi:hypothetical protein